MWTIIQPKQSINYKKNCAIMWPPPFLMTNEKYIESLGSFIYCILNLANDGCKAQLIENEIKLNQLIWLLDKQIWLLDEV